MLLNDQFYASTSSIERTHSSAAELELILINLVFALGKTSLLQAGIPTTLLVRK